MKPRSRPPRRSGCPIGIALDVLGDTWSLLIVRDLMFNGLNTFNQLRDAGEGIASNILSERLFRLEQAGILTKRPDAQDARRFIYRLTQKGIDLAPVLIELVQWSARYEKTDAPAGVVRQMRLDRDRVIDEIRKRWAAS